MNEKVFKNTIVTLMKEYAFYVHKSLVAESDKEKATNQRLADTAIECVDGFIQSFKDYILIYENPKT